MFNTESFCNYFATALVAATTVVLDIDIAVIAAFSNNGDDWQAEEDGFFFLKGLSLGSWKVVTQ